MAGRSNCQSSSTLSFAVGAAMRRAMAVSRNSSYSLTLLCFFFARYFGSWVKRAIWRSFMRFSFPRSVGSATRNERGRCDTAQPSKARRVQAERKAHASSTRAFAEV